LSTATLAVVTLAGVSAVAWQARVARQHADLAVQQRDHARRLHQVAIEESHRADQQRIEADRERQEAEAARGEAEAARQVAEDNKRTAEAQRTIALDSQEQAEANFQRAFELVNSLSQVGERLRAKPSQEQEGRRILEKALEFYEGLLVDRSSDARTKRVVAAANLRAGIIRDSLGQRGRAVALFQRSLALYDELARDQGRRPGLLRDTSRVHSSLARTLNSMERRRESESEYRDALALLEQCRGRGMNDGDLACEIALNMVSLCAVLRDLDRAAEADSLYRKAEDSLRENVRRPNAPARYRIELAQCLDEHGRLLLKLGRLPEAETRVREANAIFDELTVAAPAFASDSNAPERLPFLRNQRSVALCELARGRHVDAQRRLRAALESLTRIVAATAIDCRQQAELATAHAELISALRPTEEGEALEQAIENATAHGRRMLTLFPDEPTLSKIFAERLREWSELTSLARSKPRDGN
ncbi:MAG TPA: hypothetical protein PLV92_21245, partial [Pirellulaceae bacterium]|nr:hypothetical protein [Pirellulaceae bacterium]